MMFREQKFEMEATAAQNSLKKYHLFFSTAHPDSQDEQSGTGDVDYTQALADTINSQKFVRQNAFYIRGIFNETAIYQFIKEHAANRFPILHIMINAPRTGFAFTVEGLLQFKQLGGQLVVTSVEFAKHAYHEQGAQYQETTMAYLKIADRIIFLDDIDKEAAIDFQKLHLSSDVFLLNKLQGAEVISVLPTIPPLVDTPPQGGDIISFGMIRVGKGLAHVIKLARLVKEAQDPIMSKKKILVVGTVQPHVSNKSFSDILCALYPEKTAEISASIFIHEQQKFKTGAELKALWTRYKHQGLIPALPMELHVDVPTDALSPLFQRCTYAWLPAYRGVTLRNSSISSAAAQGFVTYSHIDEITPSDLRLEGAYHNAFVLMPDENYHTYANAVFDDILKRESEPGAVSNLQTKQNTKRMLEEALSRTLVANKHCVIYKKLALDANAAPFAFKENNMMFIEQKLKAEETEGVQKNLEKYHLFFAATNSDGHDQRTRTGDGDYTQTLADTFNQRSVGEKAKKALYIQGISDEKTIYEFIKERAANDCPILHVMINAPRIGFAFTVEGLTRFKESGGHLVVTAVEFAKHCYHKEGHQYQEMTMEYLKIADQIIFLDQGDKDSAIKFQQIHFKEDRSSFEKLQTAKVISVPPTIPPLVDAPPQGGDIIAFGMIRVGKGLAHVVKLAKLIKETQEPKMLNKKILVVGTVQPDEENRAFTDLLIALYPDKKSEIDSSLFVGGIKKHKMGVELKALWRQYKSEGLIPVLPIELYLDVPVEALGPLFQRCTYAYLPAYRGVTLRNSSISSAVAQGFVAYSHLGEITPKNLQPGGAYHKAFVLIKNDEYETYANQVFEDILRRESDPEATLNRQTKQYVKRLLDEVLSKVLMVNKHNAIYEWLTILKMSSLSAYMQEKVAPFAYHWQAVTHKNRSYKIMKEIQNINIQEYSDQNFKALLQRLRRGEGPYTSEMRTFLQANKTSDDVLTKAENDFFINMLKRDWVLKHVTDSTGLEKIKESSNTMLSLKECTLRGMNTSNCHTMPGEGHGDNIFFTFGPGADLETAKFLDHASNVITVDYKLLSKKSQKTWRAVPKSLYAMWGSDHFYAYATEQESASVVVGNCRYNVFYRNIKQGETGVHLVKICQYNRGDGTSATQIIEKGREIFIYPLINRGIIYSVIEKIRLMGLETWVLAMKMSLEEQEKLVQALYHAGVFEVHKPKSFSLNNPGVSVINRESKSERECKSEAENVSLSTSDQSMIEAAYAGATEKVLNFCTHNQNFSTVSGKLCNNDFTVTLLGAAILGGQVELVEALLNLGISIDGNSWHEGGYKGSALILAFCLSDPKDGWQIKPNKAAAFNIMKLLVEQGTVNRKNRHIRYPVPVTTDQLVEAMKLFHVDPEHILYLLNTLGTQFKPDDLPLALGVNTKSLALVQKMLDLGAEIDSRVNTPKIWMSAHDNFEYKGYPPLLVAVTHGNEPMVALLLQHGAPTEQEFCAAPVADFGWDLGAIHTPLHDFSGYTPLLMAVEKGHLLLVQLLVKNGANLFHRSATGKTAISIATDKAQETGDTSILSFLQGTIAIARNDLKESVELQMTEGIKKENAKIQQHYTHIIFTGKETGGEQFFLVGEAKTNFFACAAIPTRTFSGVSKDHYLKKMIIALNKETSLELRFANLKWTAINALSCYIPEDSAHYVDNIILCELDNPKKVKLKFSNTSYDSLRLLTASELLQDKSFHGMYELRLLKMTQALLDYINKIPLDNDENFNMAVMPDRESEHALLQKSYEEALNLQHQVLQAAKIGDVGHLGALSRQGASFWNNTPCLEPLTPELQIGFALGHAKVALQVAWEHTHLDCALFILSNSPDVHPDICISFPMVSTIIKAGHLKFYQFLCDKKFRNTDPVLSPSSVCQFLQEAIDCNQKEIALYILQTFKPTENDIARLKQLAESKGLIEVVLALASSQIPVLVQPVLPESQQLLLISNVNVAPKALEMKKNELSPEEVVGAPMVLDPSNELPKIDALSTSLVAGAESTPEGVNANEGDANVNAAENVRYHVVT